MTKYIICKPRGGLNDIFGFVTMCLKYAIRFNRILVIDTRKSLHFKDNFFKYFDINNANKHIYTSNIDTLYNSIQKCTLFAANTITTTPRNKQHINYNDFDPFKHNIRIIDLNTDYPEDVILYGSNNANLTKDIIYFFKNFNLTPMVLNKLKTRINTMPNKYISVHIRNTDYKSNVILFIKNNYSQLKNKHIFLATDDKNSIELFKTHFTPSHIYTFFQFPKSNKKYYNRAGSGIHFNIRNNDEHKIFNIDTLIDIILLANSTKYLYSCEQSGFSQGVKMLFNEKHIIQNIIMSCNQLHNKMTNRITPFRNENVKLAAHFPLISLPEGGILNKKRCKIMNLIDTKNVHVNSLISPDNHKMVIRPMKI